MDTSTLLVGFFLAITSINAAAAPAQRMVLPTDVVPTHYTLAVTPDAVHMTFTGSVQIDIDVKQATRDIRLNTADLTFSKVSLSGSTETPSVVFDA